MTGGDGFFVPQRKRGFRMTTGGLFFPKPLRHSPENQPPPVVPLYRRESSPTWTELEPRLRGGDDNSDFHLLG
jgi:hypothetical protein